MSLWRSRPPPLSLAPPSWADNSSGDVRVPSGPGPSTGPVPASLPTPTTPAPSGSSVVAFFAGLLHSWLIQRAALCLVRSVLCLQPLLLPLHRVPGAVPRPLRHLWWGATRAALALLPLRFVTHAQSMGQASTLYLQTQSVFQRTFSFSVLLPGARLQPCLRIFLPKKLVRPALRVLGPCWLRYSLSGSCLLPARQVFPSWLSNLCCSCHAKLSVWIPWRHRTSETDSGLLQFSQTTHCPACSRGGEVDPPGPAVSVNLSALLPWPCLVRSTFTSFAKPPCAATATKADRCSGVRA